MPALEVKDLTYRYPTAERPTLSGVSLSVEASEMVALVGANNAGKSTLCYALCGVVPHFYHGSFSGQVQVGGLDTAEHNIGALARQVGLVLQNPASQLSGIRHTVFEEVAFGLENLGLPRQEIGARVGEALALTGLAELGERSPYQLSGGQQQRLVLAAILAISPPILVLDEPTTLLDPQGVEQVFQILVELKQRGKTIIIAEQRLDWLAEYADRVLALAEGQVVMDGPPRQVLASARLQEIGLGWNHFTQLGDVAQQRGIWPAEEPLPLTYSEAVVGFTQAGREAGHADPR